MVAGLQLECTLCWRRVHCINHWVQCQKLADFTVGQFFFVFIVGKFCEQTIAPGCAAFLKNLLMSVRRCVVFSVRCLIFCTSFCCSAAAKPSRLCNRKHSPHPHQKPAAGKARESRLWRLVLVRRSFSDDCQNIKHNSPRRRYHRGR